MRIFMNMNGSGRGGPQVWSGRFRHLLEQRGFQFTSDLKKEWAAALFIIGMEGMEKALERDNVVAYRVANGYIPLWFEIMGHTMKPEHHATNAVIARALELADMVFYQSHWAKQELDRILYNRADRFTIIYNGVDSNLFCPPIQSQGNILVLGTVGILRYRYRLETFLEMSRKLDIPHRLLIIGSTDDECAQVLHAAKDDPILKHRIIYQPYIPPERLPDLYRQMSLLIHPVCGDVCPNVVVEAMACGVPVVAPHYGGTAELVGSAGVIFNCEPWVYDQHFIDAMTEAVETAIPNLTQLSIQARERVINNFEANYMVDQYLEAMGLPLNNPQVSSKRNPVSFIKELRQIGAKLIARPRYYLATLIRKTRSIERHFTSALPHIKPRIAFTLYDFHVGGIENWLYRLAVELGTEFDFYFIATKVPEYLPKFHQAGTCTYLPDPIKMTAYLRENNIDIVQAHNERWPIDAALAAGVPYIIERTDGTRSCTRVPKQGLSMVISSSNGTVPLIAKMFPESQIRVIYNGIDLEEVDQTPIERPWSEEAFIIGRTSRFGRGKNLGLLIQAIQLLSAGHPHLKLVLIGGDSLVPGAEPMDKELKEMAKSSGKAVEFLGIKENPLPWVKGFNVATCVSNPDNEGIPNSLIEAMACRKPIISTDVDQINELVQNGISGILIPPGDLDALCKAITRLEGDPGLCQQFGEAGRAFVEQYFSLKKVALQYADAYRSLLGS